jgi:predicted glycosyltransferase
LEKVRKQGAKPSKTYQYPGIKEGVYLWVKGLRIINERKNIDVGNQAIYIRPEPQTAQYYSGKLNFLDDILIALANEYKVVILVRDKNQLQHYSQEKFENIEVPKEPIPFEKVALNCLMFIGAGGSMTREMSMIGIPTISVYQGELLDVDNFLIKEKYLVHQPDLDLQFVKDILEESKNSDLNRTELIEKGKEAYELLKLELINLKK